MQPVAAGEFRVRLGFEGAVGTVRLKRTFPVKMRTTHTHCWRELLDANDTHTLLERVVRMTLSPGVCMSK